MPKDHVRPHRSPTGKSVGSSFQAWMRMRPSAPIVGSPATKYRYQHDYLEPLAEAGGDSREFGFRAMEEVHPMWLLRTLPNNVLAYVGIQYGFMGANQNVTAHGISGSQAVAEACRYLRDGAIDRAIVVGYDSASELEALPYYASVGLLSARGLRPFDRDRDGTVLAARFWAALWWPKRRAFCRCVLTAMEWRERYAWRSRTVD